MTAIAAAVAADIQYSELQEAQQTHQTAGCTYCLPHTSTLVHVCSGPGTTAG